MRKHLRAAPGSRDNDHGNATDIINVYSLSPVSTNRVYAFTGRQRELDESFSAHAAAARARSPSSGRPAGSYNPSMCPSGERTAAVRPYVL